jgi:hypothetical protein
MLIKKPPSMWEVHKLLCEAHWFGVSVQSAFARHRQAGRSMQHCLPIAAGPSKIKISLLHATPTLVEL